MFGTSATSLLLLAAAAGFRGVNADFMVYTVPPIPTSLIPSFTDASAAASWTTSVGLNARIAYGDYTDKLGAPYKSSSSSAGSEIAAFVATALNYSIPAAVTDDSTTTSFFSKPSWYDALPTGARSFKEMQVSAQYSIVSSVIEARATTTGKTAAAAPTAMVGKEVKWGIGAAAVAAVFL